MIWHMIRVLLIAAAVCRNSCVLLAQSLSKSPAKSTHRHTPECASLCFMFLLSPCHHRRRLLSTRSLSPGQVIESEHQLSFLSAISKYLTALWISRVSMDLEVDKTIERQTPKPRHRLGLSRRLGEGHGKCTQKHHVGPAECDQVQALVET